VGLFTETYSEALRETTYYDWFRRFKNGDLNMKDKGHAGRLKLVAELEVLLDENPC